MEPTQLSATWRDSLLPEKVARGYGGRMSICHSNWKLIPALAGNLISVETTEYQGCGWNLGRLP